MSTRAIDRLDERLEQDSQPAIDVPDRDSFREFMEKDAQVCITDERGHRRFVPYSTEGREPLALVLDTIDLILGSHTGTPLNDASLSVCGGAQFGKTIIGLHLKAYMPAVLGLHSYYVLPDNDLVSAVVDGKERPEVLDQIPWLNDMATIGKMVNESGKTVNRKGAMLFTDGKRTAMSYMRGMNKVPTTLTADCVIQDESDDIPPDKQKFLAGRMSGSQLRFFLAIGTMRYHGAGQNKLFEAGSQHIGFLTCPDCGKRINPEEAWPEICRVAMDGAPKKSDPQLTLVGDFKVAGKGETAAVFSHDDHYYFACTECGAELDRTRIDYEPQRPEMVAKRKWSIRVSQMCCSGLSVKMFVNDWCENAVKDPDAMTAFRCDRLAMPKSALQALTPEILQRARSVEEFGLSLTGRPGTARLGGLDTGDRCWFSSYEKEGEALRRHLWAEQLSPEKARERIPLLFNTLGLSCLFIDIGAERNLTRDLCFLINPGLADMDLGHIDNPDRAYISFGQGVEWDGPNQKWKGIKCAAVEFSLKSGQGIRHKLGLTQEGRGYPVIQANRDETIEKCIRDLLTAEQGVDEVIDGKIRTQPALLLAQNGPGAQAIVKTFDDHLLAGSRRIKDDSGKETHYIDKVENHLLLAHAYSRLAETLGATLKATPFAYQAVPAPPGRERVRAERGKVLI